MAAENDGTTVVVKDPFREIFEVAYENPIVITSIKRNGGQPVRAEQALGIEPYPKLHVVLHGVTAIQRRNPRCASEPRHRRKHEYGRAAVRSFVRALRQRVEFIESPPAPCALSEVKLAGIELRKLLQAINYCVKFSFDKDHAIDHGLLVDVDNLWHLHRVFARHGIQLPEEFFFWERALDARLLFDDSPTSSSSPVSRSGQYHLARPPFLSRWFPGFR
ncbi:hypothetical protein [Cupriavidus consociatus]|uniref:hypothetical protein n=1 Tax=Cupriavidus consociatus TaxID=2821357 RepID=UPI001AE18E06|nr:MULTISPECIES: hypothetical protein [unclassified Cupriavidus]MBP0625423.1 hypothetical protein [Cupriavidus sp. LEh25]MDK2662164.1 hypothetical protein [Cupriavidus sp. LEh21]